MLFIGLSGTCYAAFDILQVKSLAYNAMRNNNSSWTDTQIYNAIDNYNWSNFISLGNDSYTRLFLYKNSSNYFQLFVISTPTRYNDIIYISGSTLSNLRKYRSVDFYYNTTTPYIGGERNYGSPGNASTLNWSSSAFYTEVNIYNSSSGTTLLYPEYYSNVGYLLNDNDYITNTILEFQQTSSTREITLLNINNIPVYNYNYNGINLGKLIDSER